MGFQSIIHQLKNNQNIFENFLKGKSESEYLWRPEQGKWCLLEIVCHLLDEEVLDFRTRTKQALLYPEKDLIPINPEGWVEEHNYLSENYFETLQLFLDERSKSIEWLKQHKNETWSNALKHPELGVLSAELFLNNWLAHDYLHIRQILKYHFEILKMTSSVDLSYAGNW